MNWKARIKNKAFWVTFIPTAIIAIQAVAAVFGWSLDLSELSDRLIVAVDAVFALIAVFGNVIDPTTAGFRDSKRAMTYDKPYSEEDE